MLEKYISEHPDYWEFESELKEVNKLKKLCIIKSIRFNSPKKQKYNKCQICEL